VKYKCSNGKVVLFVKKQKLSNPVVCAIPNDGLHQNTPPRTPFKEYSLQEVPTNISNNILRWVHYYNASSLSFNDQWIFRKKPTSPIDGKMVNMPSSS
jgi:hypothetical protein